MKSLESEQQQTLFQWVRLQENKYPQLKLLHAIPNGSKRDIAVAAKLKREGVKAGVFDIFLPVARDGYHGMYIEMKYGKNKLTDNQKWWEIELIKQGYYMVTCYDWEQARNLIVKYLESKVI